MSEGTTDQTQTEGDDAMGAIENNLNACPAKQPWEMNQSEYLDSKLGVSDSSERKIGDPIAVKHERMKHKAYVRGALKEGRLVPAAVLAEYPDLAPKPKELQDGKQASLVEESCAFDSDLETIKPKNITDRGLVSYLRRESSKRYDYIQTAKDSGIVTNGKMLFRVTYRDKAVLAKVPDDKDAITVPMRTIEGLLKHVKGDYVKAKVVGARKEGLYDGEIAGDAYMLESDNGNRTAMDAKFLRIIQARYPEAKILVHHKLPNKTAIMLEFHGEIVGVVMPLRQSSYVCLPKRDTQREGGFGL